MATMAEEEHEEERIVDSLMGARGGGASASAEVG